MVGQNRYISDAVIRILPRYYRYLGELLNSGVTRVSSGELSERMGSTASQIRQDFNHFGGFGQQGYGYNVELLYKEIGAILGMDHAHDVIIIGAGHIGKALVNYPNFVKRGFNITAIFDKDPRLIGTQVSELTVLSVDDLDEYLQAHPADIAVLAIPKLQAKEMAERLCSLGIQGIWNFASTDLEFDTDTCVVENVHLTDSLLRLSYRLNNR